MRVDPKSHIEQYGVKALDSGTLRNLRMIAKFRADKDAKIRASLPNPENIALWDESVGQDAIDAAAVIAQIDAELKERGHE